MEEKNLHGGQLALVALAMAIGIGAGFVLGRLFRFEEPAPSEGPLSSEALSANWAKKVTFDSAGDGVIY